MVSVAQIGSKRDAIFIPLRQYLQSDYNNAAAAPFQEALLHMCNIYDQVLTGPVINLKVEAMVCKAYHQMWRKKNQFANMTMAALNDENK